LTIVPEGGEPAGTGVGIYGAGGRRPRFENGTAGSEIVMSDMLQSIVSP